MAEIVDPKHPLRDSWYTPDYLPPPAVTAPELMAKMSPENSHGHFLLTEFMRWIEDKAPVDFTGHQYIGGEKLVGWRRYQVSRLGNALQTLADFAVMMQNEGNSRDGFPAARVGVVNDRGSEEVQRAGAE